MTGLHILGRIVDLEILDEMNRGRTVIGEPSFPAGVGIFLAGLSATLVGTGLGIFIISALGGVGGY